jgi:GT2 family glycosyltransferase
MFEVPLAMVIFNRPQTTQICFEQVRRLKPTQLLIIADGARQHCPGENEAVQQCRQIVSNIDWDCRVTKIYSDTNLGCGQRISTGISEAMTQVDRLIILEDDCVAQPSFFTFCAELLARYESDERVMAVTGNNFQMGQRRTTASYYFSKYPHCWGWATWKRAWDKYDITIPQWPSFRDSGQLATLCRSKNELAYWTQIFDSVHARKIKSWDFSWVLACWMNQGLTALPEVNLVTNIGFGAGATHTTKHTVSAGLPTQPLEDLIHPPCVSQHRDADALTDELIFSGTVRRDIFKRIENSIRKVRKLVKIA